MKKAADSDSRMPSITAIHLLLVDKKIKHTFWESSNTVEYRSKGNRYVNSRHDGKRGYKIIIDDIEKGIERDTIGTYVITLDTSDSYYSYNTWNYANQIISLIKLRAKE